MRYGTSITQETRTDNTTGKTTVTRRKRYTCPVCKHTTTSAWSIILHAARIHHLNIPLK